MNGDIHFPRLVSRANILLPVRFLVLAGSASSDTCVYEHFLSGLRYPEEICRIMPLHLCVCHPFFHLFQAYYLNKQTFQEKERPHLPCEYFQHFHLTPSSFSLAIPTPHETFWSHSIFRRLVILNHIDPGLLLETATRRKKKKESRASRCGHQKR